MSMNEMESKIRELRQLQSLIEEAQAEAEAIKDSINARQSWMQEAHGPTGAGLLPQYSRPARKYQDGGMSYDHENDY